MVVNKVFIKINDGENKDFLTEFYSSRKQYSSDSGFDLCFPSSFKVPKHSTVMVDLEVAVRVEKVNVEGWSNGFWLIPRSSICKTPLRMSNSVGLIDAGYRNTLKVSVDNIGDEDFFVEKGQRLFQLVAADLQPWTYEIVETLDETERGQSGFGSTGK
jgi:dUTP pyrophosphatase